MRPWLATIWVCFLARAVFYCAAIPLWEGYDEWSHFAVVQRMAFRGELLVSRDAPVARDVAASLELAPVPWECRTLPEPSITRDGFWRLPASERAQRESRFREIPADAAVQDAPGGLKAYEGLQGPLYGWLMAPLLLAAKGAHLSTQVLLLRWFGVMLVSLVIPLAFAIARAIFESDAIALGCAAVVAVMPEFLIDTARVGNDGVAVVLFTLLIWMALGTLREGLPRRRAIALGVVLGLGLLAKAYFLAAVPGVAVLLAWKCRRARALIVPAVAFAIAGWWYVRNFISTGSPTGMWESVLLQPGGAGSQIAAIGRIPWFTAIDSIMLSHLYLGGWSSLTVRSWMYHLLYLVIAVAAVGLVRRAAEPAIRMAVLFFLSFWLGQLYHVIPMFLVWHIPTSLGCYLYAVVAAEVALCVAGLHSLAPRALRHFAAPAGVVLFALLDLYTIHMVAIPYYTGMIAHRPGGALEAFYPARAPLGEILPRLSMFQSPLISPPLLGALWIAYVAATIALVAISVAAARRKIATPQTRPLPPSHTVGAGPETAASCPTGLPPPPPTMER